MIQNINFINKLKQTTKDVNLELQSIISYDETYLKKIEWEKLYEVEKYSVLGEGKRLRAFLLIFFADIFEVPYSVSLKIACSLELIHCYSLIHDDLPAMDNANLRRGKQTVHKKYNEAIGILAGDALLTKAFEIITDMTDVSSDNKILIIKELAMASGDRGMIAGQFFDIETEKNKVSLSLEQLKLLQSKKTGAIFKFAIKIAAQITNQPIDIINSLNDFSHKFGLIYQITDDILDTVNSDITGKDSKLDTKNKKITFANVQEISKTYQYLDLLISGSKKDINFIKDKNSILILIELLNFIKNRKK